MASQTTPSLAALQETVHHWVETYGVRYFSELTNTAILMEEVGELARLMARYFGDQSFKRAATTADAAANATANVVGDRTAALGDEMADVLFVLVCLANQTGVDLDAAMARNLAKKTARDGERHRNNPKLTP
ncbi:MAG: nucleotide pyrophosphohydrolase [Desulfosarcinaceae bacterium]|jgi:NTP pyrophosphatase (non-canonical NTP hydrolase)